MKQEYINLFSIVRSSIYGTEFDTDLEIDWYSMMGYINTASLTGVCFSTISSFLDGKKLEAEYLDITKKYVMTRAIHQAEMSMELSRIVKRCDEENIQLISFKGPAFSRLYREPNLRFSSDYDMLVDINEREKVEKILFEMGFSWREAGSKKHVPIYVKKLNMGEFVIELHDQLWEDYEGVLIEKLKELNLNSKNSLISYTLNGVEIKTLGYIEHIIFQIFHIAKHFSFERARLRMLTDLTLFINDVIDRININDLWDKIDYLEYEKFSKVIFRICIEHLGMTKKILNCDLNSIEVKDNVISDIIEPEVENEVADRYTSIRVTSHYFLRNVDYHYKSKLEYHIRKAFPMPNELYKRYNYAKKHPVLLPIAWIHRFIYSIQYFFICKKRAHSVKKMFEKGEERLDMMKEIGLINN